MWEPGNADEQDDLNQDVRDVRSQLNKLCSVTSDLKVPIGLKLALKQDGFPLLAAAHFTQITQILRCAHSRDSVILFSPYFKMQLYIAFFRWVCTCVYELKCQLVLGM